MYTALKCYIYSCIFAHADFYFLKPFGQKCPPWQKISPTQKEARFREPTKLVSSAWEIKPAWLSLVAVVLLYLGVVKLEWTVRGQRHNESDLLEVRKGVLVVATKQVVVGERRHGYPYLCQVVHVLQHCRLAEKRTQSFKSKRPTESAGLFAPQNITLILVCPFSRQSKHWIDSCLWKLPQENFAFALFLSIHLPFWAVARARYSRRAWSRSGDGE